MVNGFLIETVIVILLELFFFFLNSQIPEIEFEIPPEAQRGTLSTVHLFVAPGSLFVILFNCDKRCSLYAIILYPAVNLVLDKVNCIL